MDSSGETQGVEPLHSFEFTQYPGGDVVQSKNGIPVRLPNERWEHIASQKKGHPELAPYRKEILQTVAAPQAIYKGRSGELIAIGEIASGKYLAVVYKESNPQDGFIITAFVTRRIKQIKKRKRIWP